MAVFSSRLVVASIRENAFVNAEYGTLRWMRIRPYTRKEGTHGSPTFQPPSMSTSCLKERANWALAR